MESENERFAFARYKSETDDVQSTLSSTDRDKVDAPRKLRAEKSTGARTSRLAAAPKARSIPPELLEVVQPQKTAHDLVLSQENIATLTTVADEIRKGDELRRHGLNPRSKLLFCGPPGCGKTLCAEVLAYELKLPLLVARLDGIITTYLGETASNLRKVFDTALRSPSIIFLDEFDALARARTDSSEHSEIRRVVNSLLMFIDRFSGRGLLIAATNLEASIDRAVWRRFDEILYFDLPNDTQIRQFLRLKTKNFPTDFNLTNYEEQLQGMSFAEIERICLNAIKWSILEKRTSVSRNIFDKAVAEEKRRLEIQRRVRWPE